MRLKKLKINNFRNFSEGEVNINDGTTVFYGAMGEGKTNLIEAVYLLSVGRSYRTNDTNQVISWGEKEAYVRGEGKNSTGNFAVAIKLTKDGKRIELNGEQSKKSIELIGGLRSVIFHSEDVGIVAGAPHVRRRYIDIAISQASRNYAYNLRDYYRILKQRNSVLAKYPHSGAGEWDDQLSTVGAWLTQVRAKVLSEISQISSSFIGTLVGEERNFSIKYIPAGDENPEKIKLLLSKTLTLDMARGSTSVGPHRDDFKIYLDSAEARYFASSGEKKTIALALKLAEMEFMRGVTGEKPILLLDDVFSALDLSCAKRLLNVTEDGSQCIITLSDLNPLREEFSREALFYEVDSGRVIPSPRSGIIGKIRQP
jgi:DNA replication and repair protein RecF